MPSAELSRLARSLKGSAILGIADEIRALVAKGAKILNLTVGDFNPQQFRIPSELEEALVEAVRAGEGNYPPPIGIESLRRAVVQFYADHGGCAPKLESVLIAGGARPVIYAVYRALVDQGERVVFGVPGWNNEYYCDMVGAEQVRVPCQADTGFLPTAEMLRPHLPGARLLAVNSPLNPTGTSYSEAEMAAICDAVLEENARRGPEERPLYLFYDQIYWMITTPGTVHPQPLALRPEIEPYLVKVDGISKVFAATGLRVGWAIAPPAMVKALNNINGHVGAWAPRPEQLATAKLLSNKAAVERAVTVMRREASARLETIYNGLQTMRTDGLPVDCLRPQGAIYASARFALHGRKTPSGQRLQTDDDVRRYLLQAARVAVVPFAAFGTTGDDGWFRLSIGTCSVADLEELMPRLRAAISALTA